MGVSAATELVGLPDVSRRRPRSSVAAGSVLRRPVWAWLCAVFTVACLAIPRPHDAVAVTANYLVLPAMLAGGWLALPSPRLRTAGMLMLGVATSWSGTLLFYLPVGPLPMLAILLNYLGGTLLSILMLLWPRSRLERWEMWWVRVAVVAIPIFGIGMAVTYDPALYGEPVEGWWPRLGGERIHQAVVTVDGLTNVVALVLLCLLIARRFWRAARLERLEMIPVLLTALASIGASIVLSLLQARLEEEIATWVLVGNNLLLTAIPLSFLVSVGVRRVQRALMVERLLRPQRDADPDWVRDALARALGDRDLELALWSPSRDTFLTPGGTPAPETDRPSVDVAGADGAPLARITVDARLADRTDLIEALATAASVALDNARLQAEVRAGRREIGEATARLAESAHVEERLARLLPGGVAALVRADPEALSRTERMTATVLMSDIRGYSTLAERADPAALAAQLNEHRRAMNDAILAEGGTVVQYVGDAVLAIFAAPAAPDHQERSLRAAAGMHRAQERLNAAWARRGLPPFGIGIGVTTGEVAVAFLGSEERAEYTVVGDTVNLAARLNEAARPAGTTVAECATVQGATGSWLIEQLPPFPVKGRERAVTAYRVAPRAASPA